MPSLGERVAGQSYIPRPSSYVVVRDADRHVAVVRTPKGVFLPGGGLERGETHETAAIREARGECGLEVTVSAEIGRSDEHVHAAAEASYFMKRSRFFRASVVGTLAESESDHQLEWLPQCEAEARLKPESHRWAVARDAEAITGRHVRD